MEPNPLTYDASLLPLLETHLEQARKAKQARVEDGKTDDNIPQLVVVVRGGKPVANLWLLGRDSSDVANLLHMATMSMMADTMLLIFEGWVALTENNPVTGEPWGPGGMDTWAEEHGGADEVVGEGLIAFAVTADGRGAQTMKVFTILNKKVFFHPPREEMMKEQVGGGYFVDAVVAGYGNQGEGRELMDKILGLLGDIPTSHKYAFMDVLSVDKMRETDLQLMPALVTVGDDERKAMLEILQKEWPAVAAKPESLKEASRRASKAAKAGMN
jgi:hypothetical protein